MLGLPEEQPRRITAEHVEGGHDSPEVASEPGVHPVVDERVEHRVCHGQPVEALVERFALKFSHW